MTKNQLLDKYLAAPTLKDELSSGKKPLVLYGTGNGADKIIEYLASLGRRPDAVFASDGFVRERTFAGLPVESFDEVAARYGIKMKILVCFGSNRAEVMERIRELDGEYDAALPDVPLYGEGVFDADYVKAHIDGLSAAREMLSDDRSRKLFDDAVFYRLTGKLKYLSDTDAPSKSYADLVSSVEYAVDCGAYKGDSALDMCRSLSGLKKITALEPDPGTFRKLQEASSLIGAEYGVKIEPVNAAAYDENCELTFSGSSSRGAGAAGKNRRAKEKTVRAVTLDSLGLDRVDFIKLDVEGDEEKALFGASELLEKYAPSLAVSVYHRTDDIWKLPLMIKDKYSGKDFSYHLRRAPCLPCWDLVFFAARNDKK
ncbi:MAG: FkbM family methyltransferase [Clostridia bacterium]|nr:FkbM family methyltransferase [Clostridia bacterium]